MEAIKYLRMKKRMCDSIPCNSCPLSISNNDEQITCSYYIERQPDKAVEIIEKWANENPKKTRQSEFLKLHPTAVLGEDGILKINPCYIREYKCPETDCHKCRKNYWSEELNS